jgi:hypothetical protein
VLRLDFFPEFKGIDAVLLSADSDGIRAILDALSHAIATPSEELPLHDIAHVAQRQPARLFLTTTRPAPNVVTSNTYYWVVSENEALTVSGLLEPLASITAGHQFFALVPPAASLIVSVGEYNAAWWFNILMLHQRRSPNRKTITSPSYRLPLFHIRAAALEPSEGRLRVAMQLSA